MNTYELKPNFEETLQRFEGWWLMEEQDRPLLNFWIDEPNPNRPRPAILSRKHASLRERWMDVEWSVISKEDSILHRPWLAESLPWLMPNVGPDLTATLYGVDLEFEKTTSFAKPLIRDIEDWKLFLSRKPDFDNIYWKTIESMTKLAFERAKGKYLVGMPDIHNSYDILVGLRSPENLCIDMLDEPEIINQAASKVVVGYREAFRRAHQWLVDAGQPAITWTDFLHDGPAYVTSCDFWCLVSDQLAREMILPRLLEEMQDMERTIFHLDGPRALRHLDILLDHMPKLNAVQWIYGAGQGNAQRWLHVYKKCLAAGRSIQVLCEDAEDALCATEALGSRGVWLSLMKGFHDKDEANRFIERIKDAAAVCAH